MPFWTSRKKQQIGGLHKFYVTTQNFFIKYQMFKYSRETFAMKWKCQKFFSVFEIFEVAFRERNHLGIRNVTFRLFVNNYHLYFFLSNNHLWSSSFKKYHHFSVFSVFIFSPILTYWAISQLLGSVEKSHITNLFLYWPQLTFQRI